MGIVIKNIISSPKIYYIITKILKYFSIKYKVFNN